MSPLRGGCCLPIGILSGASGTCESYEFGLTIADFLDDLQGQLFSLGFWVVEALYQGRTDVFLGDFSIIRSVDGRKHLHQLMLPRHIDHYIGHHQQDAVKKQPTLDFLHSIGPTVNLIIFCRHSPIASLLVFFCLCLLIHGSASTSLTVTRFSKFFSSIFLSNCFTYFDRPSQAEVSRLIGCFSIFSMIDESSEPVNGAFPDSRA